MKDELAAKEGGVQGTELLNELSTATGLPDDLIGEELSRLISNAGKSTATVTLDDLRDMLASYLQDILLDAKDSFQSEARGEVEAAAASLDFNDTPAKAEATSTRIFHVLGNTAADFIGED